MAISLTSGAQTQRVGGQSIENLSQSTATAQQTLSNTTYVSALAGGTATGGTINLYLLSDDAPDGTEKLIYQVATGESRVQLTMATGLHYLGRDVAGIATATNAAGAIIGAATGALVFGAKGSWVRTIMLNDGWTILGGSATFGTGT